MFKTRAKTVFVIKIELTVIYTGQETNGWNKSKHRFGTRLRIKVYLKTNNVVNEVRRRVYRKASYRRTTTVNVDCRLSTENFG